jgi:glycerate kinase
VEDPLGRPVQAGYGWVAERRLAVVEVADASGLPRLALSELDPERASTYGTGQLMAAALDRGAREIVLGLGGSATVDGGTGILAALGVVFRDAQGRPIERPGGGDLARIARIEAEGLDARLAGVAITMASDVMNPLLGPDGAVQVFGPQKGVRDLGGFETAMARFADLLAEATGRDRRDDPGSGAAGGIACALRAFLAAEIRDGLSIVAERADLDAALAGADLAITGEGRLDRQSLMGKTPVAIARRARAAGCACVALAGSIGADGGTGEAFAAEGLDLAWPIVDHPMALETAMADAARLIADAAERLMRALALGARIAG